MQVPQMDWTIWLRQQRRRAVNIQLGLVLVLGLLGIAASLWRWLTGFGYTSTLPVYVIAYIGVLLLSSLPSIRDEWRARGFLIILYGFGAFSLYSGWLAGGGRTFLVALTVVATILATPRAGVVAAIVSIATYAAFAFAFSQQWIVLRELPNPVNPSPMIVEGVGFAMSVGMAAMSLWFFSKALMAATEANRETLQARALLAERARELEAANLALAKGQANFHSIVERSTDGVVVVEEQGIVCFANAAAESFFPRIHQGLTGQLAPFAVATDRVVELDFERKSQERGVAELRIVNTDWEGKPAYLALLRDITKRKRAEEALRVSEDKFSKAFHSSPDVISISSVRDGRFVEINEGFENLLGYRREEVIGRTALELNTWRHSEDRRTALAALETQGQVRVQEVVYRAKDGRLVTCLLSAEIIDLNGAPHLLAVSRDITERKQAEEALKGYAEQAQQRAEQLATMNEISRAVTALQDLESVLELIYRQVQRIAPVDAFYIGLYDAEHERITFPLMYDIGQRYSEPAIPLERAAWIVRVIRTGKPFMLHCTAEELQSSISGGLGNMQRKSASILLVPLWRKEWVVGVLSVQSYTLDAYTEEHAEILTGIGLQAAIAIENAQLYEQAQQEIAERKRAHLEREQLIAELEAKNAELERFTYTVSHDLKAPLITIRGFLGFVEKDALTGNTDRLKADIHRIAEATDKMQRLLNELLELSRIGRMMNPPLTVPFEAIVREAIELVRGRIQARGVIVQVAKGLPSVSGDRARLVEVVQNLVDNACKFMGDQPEPRIEIGAHGADGDGKPILFVRDNGVGIEPQYHERIFGLFNKLDAQTEGTGVGLALVKRIIEVHGGRIWVESELGLGATFYFTLGKSAETA